MAVDFYSTDKWKHLRQRILRRDGFKDQVLARYGKIAEATIVHHIFPREEFPEYRYAVWNLISVSLATHNRLHDRESDELTPMGIELLRRTARRNGVDVPMKYLEVK